MEIRILLARREEKGKRSWKQDVSAAASACPPEYPNRADLSCAKVSIACLHILNFLLILQFCAPLGSVPSSISSSLWSISWACGVQSEPDGQVPCHRAGEGPLSRPAKMRSLQHILGRAFQGLDGLISSCVVGDHSLLFSEPWMAPLQNGEVLQTEPQICMLKTNLH